MSEELKKLREQYDEICEKRWEEIDLPEHEKTLKTQTFVDMERELLNLCNLEKIRLGLNVERIGRSYGKSYGPRKRGSWQGRKHGN